MSCSPSTMNPDMLKICCLIISFSFLGIASAQTPALRTFATVPQGFEPNRGQASQAVDFTSHGPGYTLSLTAGAAYLQLFAAAKPGHTKRSSALSLRLVGADPRARADGL